MRPEAPAILIEWPDALVEIVWAPEQLYDRIDLLPRGRQLEILDSNGGRFVTEHDQNGSISSAYTGHDGGTIRTKLMALAGAEHRFNPEELKSARQPQEMFAAFAREIAAQQSGPDQPATLPETKAQRSINLNPRVERSPPVAGGRP